MQLNKLHFITTIYNMLYNMLYIHVYNKTVNVM